MESTSSIQSSNHPQEMFLYIRKQEQTMASQQADLGSYLTLNRDLSTRVQVLEDTNPYVLVLIDGDGLLVSDLDPFPILCTVP
jgi:hypothetical protein